MRVKFTIAVCALLMLGLVASQAYAQGEGGYNVTKSSTLKKVVYGGNNQRMPALEFPYVTTGNRAINITTGGTITISFGHTITNAAGTVDDGETILNTGVLECAQNANENMFDGDCSGMNEPSLKVINEDGVGMLQITLGEQHIGFRVMNIRLDVSALSVGDKIAVAITSSETPGQIPLGGAPVADTLSGQLAEVAEGLKVTAETDAGLSCGDSTVVPSITVAEGFPGAWNDTLAVDAGVDTQTLIKVAVKGLPKDDKIMWFAEAEDGADAMAMAFSQMVAIGEDDMMEAVGTLTAIKVEGVTKEDGSVIVFQYSIPTDAPAYDKARSIKLTPSKITIANSATLDIHSIMVPHAEKDSDGNKTDLTSQVSFESPAVYPEDGMGMEWAVVSDCVTYLLYPFITCGYTEGWTTGISVSNTSRDEGVFGAFDKTDPQSGSVILYGFPRNGGGEEMPDVVMKMVSEDLAAGDTVSFTCDEGETAGMEGYAIIKADFQHARGMAFVLGNFEDGGAYDVSHGYTAEVIDDPLTRTDVLD